MPASSTPAVPASCCCSTRRCTSSAATRCPSRSSTSSATARSAIGSRRSPTAARAVDGELDVSEQRYEVMYFLDLADERIDEFKHGWGAIGDSIVVVGGDGLWNCHVHTNDIGAAIEVALDARRAAEADPGHRPVRGGRRRARPPHRRHAPRRSRRPPACAAAPVAGSRRSPPRSSPCAPATASPSCSPTSACRASSRAARRMNPSTAELLDTVEHVNADQVVILPNNKNIIPVAQQVDALTIEDGAWWCRPGRCPRRWRRSSSTTPRRRAPTTRAEMTEAAESVATGEVTQAVRDTQQRGRPDQGRRLDRPRSRRRHRVGRVRRRRMRRSALLDHLVAPSRELVTVITGADADRRHDGRDRGMARRPPRRRAGRGAPRRPAAVPVPVRRRVTRRASDGDRSRFATWPTSTSAACAGVGEQKREALAAFEIENVLDLVTTYPRRWVDRTNEARIADLVTGDEALVLVTVRSVAKRLPRNRRTMVNRQCRRRHGAHGGGVLQPAVARTPAHEGLQVALFGKADTYRGGLQMTNPIVDLIGDRTGRIVAIYPQSEKVAAHHVGAGRLDRGGAATVPAARHRRSGAGRRSAGDSA